MIDMNTQDPLPDYYTILNVSETASDDDIKAAYKKLALKLHPDHNSNDPEANKKFQELAEAYEILSNTGSRSQYDGRHTAATTANFTKQATCDGNEAEKCYERIRRDGWPLVDGELIDDHTVNLAFRKLAGSPYIGRASTVRNVIKANMLAIQKTGRKPSDFADGLASLLKYTAGKKRVKIKLDEDHEFALFYAQTKGVEIFPGNKSVQTSKHIEIKKKSKGARIHTFCISEILPDLFAAYGYPEEPSLTPGDKREYAPSIEVLDRLLTAYEKQCSDRQIVTHKVTLPRHLKSTDLTPDEAFLYRDQKISGRYISQISEHESPGAIMLADSPNTLVPPTMPSTSQNQFKNGAWKITARNGAYGYHLEQDGKVTKIGRWPMLEFTNNDQNDAAREEKNLNLLLERGEYPILSFKNDNIITTPTSSLAQRSHRHTLLSILNESSQASPMQSDIGGGIAVFPNSETSGQSGRGSPDTTDSDHSTDDGFWENLQRIKQWDSMNYPGELENVRHIATEALALSKTMGHREQFHAHSAFATLPGKTSSSEGGIPNDAFYHGSMAWDIARYFLTSHEETQALEALQKGCENNLSLLTTSLLRKTSASSELSRAEYGYAALRASKKLININPNNLLYSELRFKANYALGHVPEARGPKGELSQYYFLQAREDAEVIGDNTFLQDFDRTSIPEFSPLRPVSSQAPDEQTYAIPAIEGGRERGTFSRGRGVLHDPRQLSRVLSR